MIIFEKTIQFFNQNNYSIIFLILKAYRDFSCYFVENKHHALPLFGHFCCRLAAQPDCVNKEICIGNINLNGRNCWARLQGFEIRFWESRKLAEEDQSPAHTIPINRVSLKR